MKNCNTPLTIHDSFGTTQQGRDSLALKPSYFLLDERNEESFILFVQKLAKYVNYYNEFDTHESDWSNFFQKESTAILIYLGSWNVELLQHSFEIKKNEIYIITDFATQQVELVEYFNKLKHEFEDLLQRAEALDNEIIEKENLLASAYVIKDKFDSVIAQINSADNIVSLLKNFVFVKTTQQLFGLLLSWKNFSHKAVAYQLEKYAKHTPHYALFLSFLKLLSVAKEKFNEFTKNHLDFYYKDVLKIQNKAARPDYVHLVVEPYITKPFLIPKDTIFPAGKNGNGQDKFYALTADQTINQIKLNALYSFHKNGHQYYKTSDLIDVNAKGSSFDIFASNKQAFNEGIMLASPLLFMQSGERNIYLRFNNANFNANDFNFYITSEKKGIEITHKINSEGFIKLTIPASEKAIIPFDPKIHEDFLVQTVFPVLKIIPKDLNILTSVSSIELKISVNNFKSFVLQSDFGNIDVEKPFYPFGEFPKKGNGVIVSSNEFFMKSRAVATFGITTFSKGGAIAKASSKEDQKDIIDEELSANLSTKELTQAIDASELNISFKTNEISLSNRIDWIDNRVNIYQLADGQWKESSDSLEPIQNNYPFNEYYFNEVVSEEIVSNGKFRIELNDNAYEGENYMQQFILASKHESDIELPYKPRIKEFIFDYSVEETINLSKRKKENNIVEVFHVLPYGYTKKEKGTVHFTNLNDKAGFVYFGFDTIETKDSLNILIQLEESTSNPLLLPATIEWHFLSNNLWTEFNENSIGDETLSLTQSGLVNITVPEFKASTNTVLPPKLFWIRLSISNMQAICKFFGIHVQACKAVLTDFENTGIEYLEHTPKETISKTYQAVNGVKKIIQPYHSFSGRIAEQDNALYIRASERLRHKSRAITIWDYERMVLEEFPEVYRVKCLNHYRYDTTISNVSAGYVTLIAIARASKSDNISWKPLLSLNKMTLIKEFLYKKTSPHGRLMVRPPMLEKVQVNFKVKFHLLPGMDTRLYMSQLKETINNYLSPWAYNDDELNFANEIEFSSIIQLIDNQSYVDYITEFKVQQFKLDENNEIVGNAIQNLNKISPQSDFTLFIPTETHSIIAI